MMSVAVILADESKKSGPIGLVVILVLCIACYFLFKSMSGHMRKVREDFPADAAPAPGPAAPSGDAASSRSPAAPSSDAQPAEDDSRED